MAVMVQRAIPSVLPTIPNLALHVSADSGVFVDAGTTPATNGQTAYQWNDQSGQSHHVSQGVSNRRPTYRATGFNGQPALQFYDNEMSSAAFVDATYDEAVSVFWIGQRLERGGRVSVDGTAFSVSHTATYIDFWVANLTTIYYAFGAQALPGDVVCVGMSYDGATVRTIVNGHLRTMPNTGTLGISGAVRLGQYTGNATATGAMLAEALVWRSGMTDTQMRQMCTYLLARWGYSRPTVSRIVVCVGDSLTKDINYIGYPLIMSSAIGNTEVSHNAAAYPGGGLGWIGGLVPAELDAVYLDSNQAVRINTIWAGSNDLTDEFVTPAESAASIFALTEDYCAARRAAGWQKLVVFTVLPRTYIGMPAGYEDCRQAFNTLMRADWSTIADALCDVAADERIGVYGAQFDTDYFLPDAVHINDGGHAVVAELLQPIIELLI